MRAAAHDVRCAGDYLHGGLLRRFRRRHRHRKLADTDAVGSVLGNFFDGAVVVAGQRHLTPRRARRYTIEQGTPIGAA